jgi:transposase
VHALQADETTVGLLKPNQDGYVWAYHSVDPDNRFIRFEFRLGRDQSGPNQRLANFRGILQTDGYSGYNAQRERNDIINVGCWDHARRYVVDTIKICDRGKEGVAGELLIPINALYHIERQAKTMTDKERQALRGEKAQPLLDAIYEKTQSIRAPPKSYLGKAVTYLLNQWPTLIEYIKYGEIPISNILIENQMRPLKLGAKNWLFVGNEQSANRGMLLYSLIQTCLMNDIHPRYYLIYVLDHAQAMRRGDIDPISLLPQYIDRSLLVNNGGLI